MNTAQRTPSPTVRLDARLLCDRHNPGARLIMSAMRRTALLLLMVICIVALTPMAGMAAGDIAQQTGKLQQLRKQIGAIKQDLDSMRGQRSDLQTALEKTEKEIGHTTAELHQLQLDAEATRLKIVSLNDARAAEQEMLTGLRKSLVQDMRSGYAAGRQQRIKLLLNQQDSSGVARMLAYHGYLSRARADRMHAVQQSVEHLGVLEASLEVQQADITRIQQQQAEHAEQLLSEQAERKVVLAALKGDLQARARELGTLQQDEQQMQSLLQSLRQAMREVPPGDAGAISLRKLKGKLQWPVAGRITQRYGAKQATGGLSSSGIFIASVAAADVHAIAAGRVAFADWLRGFGLLLIIDHGDGYMSLYGQNRSLYKDVGSWVNRGEVIAAAGNSGGQLRDGLYLELRKDGRPFNPSAWFKGKPAALQAGR